MNKAYVEWRDEGYWIANSRVSLVMLQIKLDFCGSLISYKLGSDKGGVHVEEA